MSKVDVWNVASAQVGGPIVQSETDISLVARSCDALWNSTLDTFLEEHSWNGATKTAVLLPLTTPPVGDVWSHMYELPGDALRVFALNKSAVGSLPGVWWERSMFNNSPVILTNESSLEVFYVYRVVSVGSLSGKARWALGFLLAIAIAPRIGKTQAQIEALRSAYEVALTDAKACDGQEQSPLVFTDTSLVDARQGYRRRQLPWDARHYIFGAP